MYIAVSISEHFLKLQTTKLKVVLDDFPLLKKVGLKCTINITTKTTIKIL